MNMYRMLALGLIVAAASASCDAPNSGSGIYRQDAPAGHARDEVENQARNPDAEFSAGEDSKEAGRGELATDTMQGAEYGRARAKCDELKSGGVRDECVERAQADFAQR